MLILTQDDRNAITLEDRFKVEIFTKYENPFELLDLERKEPPKISGYYIRLSQNEDYEDIGEFRNLVDTKQVLKNLVEAYERGHKVFRVPYDNQKQGGLSR